MAEDNRTAPLGCKHCLRQKEIIMDIMFVTFRKDIYKSKSLSCITEALEQVNNANQCLLFMLGWILVTKVTNIVRQRLENVFRSLFSQRC